MARRRGRRGRRGGFKLPVISIAILGSQLFAAHTASGGDAAGTFDQFVQYYTGFSPMTKQFYPKNLLIGYGPWLLKRFLLPIARPRLGGMHLPVSLS